jgi:hypothetical protein
MAFFRISNILFFVLCINFCLKSQNDAPMRIYTQNLAEKVSDPSMQVGNIDPNSLANLPIGLAKEVGGHKYIIAIDSAYFYTNGAYFNAYTAFDFPGTDEKLAFCAKNIKFNPKGVVGGSQSKLVLVSQHTINIGPHTKLILPNDGNNYVEWDCNGFQSIHLKGIFQFSKGILEPDSASTNQEYVTATFEIHANDIYNIVTQVNISPFRIRGLKDFGFTVTNAILDLSDAANSPAMVFPSSYPNTYGPNIALWRGFFLQQFSVRLPSELQRKEGAPITINANNMIIDDAGISGLFSVNNLTSLSEGDMHGWPFSIKQFGIDIVTNNLNGGFINGEISIPVLDNNTLSYNACISKNNITGKADYLFSIQPKSGYNFSCLAAEIQIYNTSSFTISRKFGKFKPQMILNGKISVVHSNCSMPSIAFQQLGITTESPFINSGIFSLSSGLTNSNKVGNFPIVVSDIALGVYNGKPSIGVNIALNLSEGNPNGFSAETHLKVISKVETQLLTNYTVGVTEVPPVKTIWSFDKVKIDDIHLEVETQPFKFDGIIIFYDNEATYGKGFFGNLIFTLPNILESPITITGGFGRTTFNYWFADVAVPINKTIPGSQIEITQLRGGMSYHMSGNKSNNSLVNDINNNAGGTSSGQTYIPNESIGIGFRAGVGFNYVRDDLLNGDVVLGVTFNSSGGLNNINLLGNAYLMVKRNERLTASNRVYGSINVLYDHANKIFNADMNANIDFQDKVTGYGYTKLYIDPDLWYFWAGRPSVPCNVNIYNLASATAYFMVGQNLEPMAPPPPQLTSLISNYSLNNQRNIEQISNGNGMAVGVNLNVGFDRSIGWDNFEIYGSGSVGAGFDMTMIKYGPNVKCEGSTTTGIGLRNWYLQGRLYAWLSLNTGIRGSVFGSDFDVSLLNANAAILLEGKLPKPTYVSGYVHIDATVLSAIHVELDFDFDFGSNCTIING